MGYLDRKARIKFYEELKKAGKTKIQLQENLLKEEAETVPVVVVTSEEVAPCSIPVMDECPVVVEPNKETDPGEPKSVPTENIGIADMLIQAITDEYATIAQYNSLVAILNDTGYSELAAVVSHINEEEQIHVGMLQHAMEEVSKQAKKVEDGKQEAEQIISGEPVVEEPVVIEVASKAIEQPLEEAVKEDKIEEAQALVDAAIKCFGRIGGGLYDDLDEMGLYVAEEDGNYIVKKKVPDAE